MPENRRPKAGPGRRRRGVRTDGAPRLVAPGERGNPSDRIWHILWSVERRTRAVSTGATDEGGARAFLARWQAARTTGEERRTVNQVLDDYEAAVTSRQARAGRHPVVISNLKGKIAAMRAHFGPLAPGEITAAYIDLYIENCRDEGLSDATISARLRYLRAALNRAARRKEIADAPTVHTPGGDRPRKRVLSRTELRALTQALNAPRTPLHVRAYVGLALLTGQRGRHLRPLRWEHVDWEAGMLWVTRANPDAASNKQCQDVPITEALGRLLQEVQAAARTPYLIEWNDAPVHSIKTAWAKLRKRAGIEGIQLRDMRRSVATLAVEAGASMTAVAALLNNDEAVTRRHYAQVSGIFRDVLARIEFEEGSE